MVLISSLASPDSLKLTGPRRNIWVINNYSVLLSCYDIYRLRKSYELSEPKKSCAVSSASIKTDPKTTLVGV
jgi:hypothetical protein